MDIDQALAAYRKGAKAANCRTTFFDPHKDGSATLAMRKLGHRSIRIEVKDWQNMSADRLTGIVYRACIAGCASMPKLYQRTGGEFTRKKEKPQLPV